MNKYQRSLFNKINDLTTQLQSDWEMKASFGKDYGMTRKEIREANGEIKNLREKLRATYERA